MPRATKPQPFRPNYLVFRRANDAYGVAVYEVYSALSPEDEDKLSQKIYAIHEKWGEPCRVVFHPMSEYVP